MKEVSGNVCADCAYFTQYYTVKCFHNFESSEYGLCGVKNETVKTVGVCENFSRQKWRRITAEEIDKAIAVITDLKQLL